MNLSERSTRRVVYAAAVCTVILVGIGSRLVSLGTLVTDKYLGDALYAVMLYLLLRIAWPTRWKLCAIAAIVAILAIECFQLTGIPMDMRRGQSQWLRIVSILLGTKFGWLDILAYFVGLAIAFGIDTTWLRKRVASNENLAAP